ncbi:MAG: hypothetical protein GY835_15410 [bacterium]|nr:hypothetical protein [bacterium]
MHTDEIDEPLLMIRGEVGTYTKQRELLYGPLIEGKKNHAPLLEMVSC